MERRQRVRERREGQKAPQAVGCWFLSAAPSSSPSSPVILSHHCHISLLKESKAAVWLIQEMWKDASGGLGERAGRRPKFWWWSYPGLLSRGRRNWENEAAHSHLRCPPPTRALCRPINSNSVSSGSPKDLTYFPHSDWALS